MNRNRISTVIGVIVTMLMGFGLMTAAAQSVSAEEPAYTGTITVTYDDKNGTATYDASGITTPFEIYVYRGSSSASYPEREINLTDVRVQTFPVDDTTKAWYAFVNDGESSFPIASGVLDLTPVDPSFEARVSGECEVSIDFVGLEPPFNFVVNGKKGIVVHAELVGSGTVVYTLDAFGAPTKGKKANFYTVAVVHPDSDLSQRLPGLHCA